MSETVIHPKLHLPPDKIPRVKRGPLGLLTWFHEMTRRYGDHPRLLAECPGILEKAGIEHHDVSEAMLMQATRECLPLAKEWAEQHNADEAAGKAIGFVIVEDGFWLTGRHTDPTVRRRKAEILETMNLRVPEDAPEPYTTTVTEPNTAPEQETTMSTATATKPLRVTESAAVALLKDLGFLNADKYDATKLTDKLQRLGKAGPSEGSEPNESSEKLLKKLSIAVNDGQEIEVTGGKPAPDASTNGHAGKKKKVKDKPADEPAVTETPPDAEPETEEKPAKAKKDKKAKPAKDAVAGKAARMKKPDGEKRGMSLLDAAVKVLSVFKNPLSPREIVEKAVEKGYWTPGAGLTPWDTVKAAMICEISKKGKESRFTKPEPGKYTLNK